MNGHRLTERMLCTLMQAVVRHGRVHHKQILSFILVFPWVLVFPFDHVSLRKMNGVSFTTYRCLRKQNDDSSSSSSSSGSDSSDSSDSDTDDEKLKKDTPVTHVVGKKKLAEVDADNVLNKLASSGNKIPEDKDSPQPTRTELLLNLLHTKKSGQVEGSSTEPTSVDSKELMAMLKKTDKQKPEQDFKVLKDVIDEKDNKNLISEAQKLSSVLPGNKVDTEVKLIGQLLRQFETTAQQKTKSARKQVPEKVPQSLSSVMEGMQTVSKQGRKESSYNVTSDYHETDQRPMRAPGSGLFEGTPLGIFTKEYMKTAKSDKKGLYETVQEEDRSPSQYYPPENAFEEHIQWTREGKLWTFPIDNEAGWAEEKNSSFQDHVFLENQLVGFPKKGPIRHFMELVTLALSKNPYLSVAQKQENIDWYRSYFNEKQEMLEERLGSDGLVQAEQVVKQ